MYSFAKDLKFMEELVDRGFNRAACVVLVSDRPFYEGKINNGFINTSEVNMRSMGTSTNLRDHANKMNI